ncbi:MAG: hypothetical protein HUJ26_24710 [Planctomycetaceae bacterium]|nr:hypothetical protein [Planctomycetaceae bacterium]
MTLFVPIIFLMSLATLDADDFERAPIHYSKATPNNAVTELQNRLTAGEVKLDYHPERGYLDSLLKTLEISPKSQSLVYSKTSLQIARIRPRTPRAIFFNDELYVGYCQLGDVMEISVADPELGTVFYTLEQSETDHPQFVRQTDNCLICHSSSRTDNVPGHLIRSLFVNAGGQPMFSAGSYVVDQTTAWEKRWGGWYVTGTHGKTKHLGNLIIRDRSVPRPVDNSKGQNVTTLDDFFRTEHYPTPHSDLVALTVLAHQVKGHNLITRANFTTRQALHYQETLNEELGEDPDHQWESTTRRIRSATEDLLEYLLCSEEAPQLSPISGTSGFAEEFSTRGPTDRQGRSLYQLDLQTRLLKYPCSYLIYTDSFVKLPTPVLTRLGQRMNAVLSEKETDEKWDHLSTDDCRAIREILVATRKQLPKPFIQPFLSENEDQLR